MQALLLVFIFFVFDCEQVVVHFVEQRHIEFDRIEQTDDSVDARHKTHCGKPQNAERRYDRLRIDARHNFYDYEQEYAAHTRKFDNDARQLIDKHEFPRRIGVFRISGGKHFTKVIFILHHFGFFDGTQALQKPFRIVGYTGILNLSLFCNTRPEIF